MWKPLKSEEEIRYLFNEFFRLYSDNYSITTKNFIEDNFFRYLGQPVVPDVLTQIYHELGLVPTEESYYYAYLDMLTRIYDINRNIADIGCGVVPAFSSILSDKQTKGTVTAFDPRLAYPSSNNGKLILKKEEFTYDEDVTNYDLIIGIMPCDATEVLLRKAIENDKDFFVAMCGCSHFEVYSPYMMGISPEYYRELLIEKVKRWLKKYDAGDLSIDYLDDKYEIPYPILYKK